MLASAALRRRRRARPAPPPTSSSSSSQTARRLGVRFTEANLGWCTWSPGSSPAAAASTRRTSSRRRASVSWWRLRRFDHRRGFRFATYALFWIRAYAGAAAAGMLGDLNLPTSRATQLRTVRGVEAALSPDARAGGHGPRRRGRGRALGGVGRRPVGTRCADVARGARSGSERLGRPGRRPGRRLEVGGLLEELSSARARGRWSSDWASSPGSR